MRVASCPQSLRPDPALTDLGPTWGWGGQLSVGPKTTSGPFHFPCKTVRSDLELVTAGEPKGALGSAASRPMIQFVLLVNKQGQTRLCRYTRYEPLERRTAFEADVVRLCLRRRDSECSFFDHGDLRIVFRRYAALFFIVGISKEENELSVLEFIHAFVETLDRYFENVCELDIMFHVEKAHFILEEMMQSGKIVEANKSNILTPIHLLDRTMNEGKS